MPYFTFSMLLLVAAAVCIGYSIATVADPPIAIHQLVVVNASSSALVRLRGFDVADPKLKFSILSLPQTGQVYQLSKVFSDYGYSPIFGSVIGNTNTVVTGSQNRIYYKRPSNDKELIGQWDRVSFSASSEGRRSYEGYITFVPPSGILVASDFLLSDEAWTIVGNKAISSPPRHEQFSRGSAFSNYIVGIDDNIKLSLDGRDAALWYFKAPQKFYGNWGIAYGGMLSFSLLLFAGNFESQRLLSSEIALVEMECADCVGPVSRGIKLVYPLSAVRSSSFDSSIWKFDITLSESSGWLKDSQNVLSPWLPVTQCDMIQVLSRLTNLRILGDVTSWYETVALDNVRIHNLRAQLPLCAMKRSDASVCHCDKGNP